jgi:hypothetical protein
MIRIAFVFALVACGGKPAEHKEPPLLGFERKMCACQDKECAKRVIAEFAAWSKRVPDHLPKPDPAVAAEILERYNKCMARAVATP